MLDFSLTEEQERFREKVREWARRMLVPHRRRWDQNREYPYEIIEKYTASGLAEEARRIGPSNVLRGIWAEEVAAADFNCVYPLMPVWAGVGASGGVGMGFPPEIAEQVARGEKLQALAITEAETGSDAGHMRTTAVRAGDDWVLNGEKNTVSTLNADYFLVFARTGPLEEGARAVSGFLVPRDTPGVTVSEPYRDMGNRATPRGLLTLRDVRVPASHRVSGDGEQPGFAHLGGILDTNRAIIGLICLGAARASVEETVAHARERVVFGQPISRYQGVAFPLVEAHTLMEAARLLCYKALWMADQGMRHTVEGAMIKWWVPRLAGDIIRECLTLNGHRGYTEDLPHEQRLRDVLGWEIGDGTAQVCKLIVARALFGREAAPL